MISIHSDICCNWSNGLRFGAFIIGDDRPSIVSLNDVYPQFTKCHYLEVITSICALYYAKKQFPDDEYLLHTDLTEGSFWKTVGKGQWTLLFGDTKVEHWAKNYKNHKRCHRFSRVFCLLHGTIHPVLAEYADRVVPLPDCLNVKLKQTVAS